MPQSTAALGLVPEAARPFAARSPGAIETPPLELRLYEAAPFEADEFSPRPLRSGAGRPPSLRPSVPPSSCAEGSWLPADVPLIGPKVCVRWISNRLQFALLQEADRRRLAQGRSGKHYSEIDRLKRGDLSATAGRYYFFPFAAGEEFEQQLDAWCHWQCQCSDDRRAGVSVVQEQSETREFGSEQESLQPREPAPGLPPSVPQSLCPSVAISLAPPRPGTPGRGAGGEGRLGEGRGEGSADYGEAPPAVPSRQAGGLPPFIPSSHHPLIDSRDAPPAEKHAGEDARCEPTKGLPPIIPSSQATEHGQPALTERKAVAAQPADWISPHSREVEAGHPLIDSRDAPPARSVVEESAPSPPLHPSASPPLHPSASPSLPQPRRPRYENWQPRDCPLLGPKVCIRWISNLLRVTLQIEADQRRLARGLPAKYEAEIDRLLESDLTPGVGLYYVVPFKTNRAFERRTKQKIRRIADQWHAAQSKSKQHAPNHPTSQQKERATANSLGLPVLSESERLAVEGSAFPTDTGVTSQAVCHPPSLHRSVPTTEHEQPKPPSDERWGKAEGGSNFTLTERRAVAELPKEPMSSPRKWIGGSPSSSGRPLPAPPPLIDSFEAPPPGASAADWRAHTRRGPPLPAPRFSARKIATRRIATFTALVVLLFVGAACLFWPAPPALSDAEGSDAAESNVESPRAAATGPPPSAELAPSAQRRAPPAPRYGQLATIDSIHDGPAVRSPVRVWSFSFFRLLCLEFGAWDLGFGISPSANGSHRNGFADGAWRSH